MAGTAERFWCPHDTEAADELFEAVVSLGGPWDWPRTHIAPRPELEYVEPPPEPRTKPFTPADWRTPGLEPW